MGEETSYFSTLREYYKPLLAVLLAAIVAIALPALSVIDFGGPDYSVQVLWPQRLSADAPSKLPVMLRSYKDAPMAGEATLYYGWRPDDRRWARAVDDGEFREIARGAIDEHGIGVLDVPGAEPLPARAEDDDDDVAPALLLRVDAGGHERWLRHTLQTVDAPVLALTLDRPLYQPGQTIKMRGLVASATSGKPLDTKAQFIVRDAKSNLVLDEEVETGPNGVAATELVLADRCVQGSYEVVLTAGGETITERVDVRPFRLPRFKVDVTPAGAEASPGEPFEARVVATHTYGEPVVDADVVVEARVGLLPLPESRGKTGADGAFDVQLAIPRNAMESAAIDLSATVTSVAGRAEVGASTARVAGRRATVEIVPANVAQFVYQSTQRAFVIVRDRHGNPLPGAAVELIVPEFQRERTIELTTDAAGRAAFDWTFGAGGRSYASVRVQHKGAVLFKRTVHVTVGHGAVSLGVDRSVANVGDAVKIAVAAESATGAVVLLRDGVTLASVVVPAGAAQVELSIPDHAAGFATVALLRDGAVQQQAPLWVRQRGGDGVEIALAQPEVRPGTQTKIELAFPAPEGDGDGDVTFGLVGVDEALYALKERAGVPLYVLMRRAPTTIFDALAAFDGVDRDDVDSWQIATHRFRASVHGTTSLNTSSQEDTSAFRRHERSRRLHIFAWLCLIGLLAVVVQMGRWTWSSVSKDAFTWRRTGAQVAFAAFCGIFAFTLAVGSPQMLMGGLSVWTFIALCWLVAAAVRLPGVPFGAWLTAHVLGVALIAAITICLSDLAKGSSAEFFVLQAGIALPVLLAAVQWFVWAFILMRNGETRAGLAIGSTVGVLFIGGLGFGVTLGSGRAAPGFARHHELAPAPMMAQMEEADGESGFEPEFADESKPTAPAGPAGPRVRSWFPETMVWLPEITGTGGKASVDVEVPDSITTWRLDAWANSADGRFGQGQAKLLAVQPYFVQLDVPLEVIDGDRFEVPVTLVNRSDAALEVDLQATTDGPLVLRGAQAGTTRLEPGAREFVWLNLTATGVGDANITVSSSGADQQGDAVRRTIRVRPDGRVLRNSASAIVGKGWETRVNMPRDVIPNTRFADVRLFGSLIADALGGLESMLAYPNGCFEQTSSANYPNVMVLRALRDMKAADWPDGVEDFQKTHANAARLVRIGYQRILSFQRPDGGFALYPDRASSDVMLTAYGILQLVWASEVTDVDLAVIQRAADWLVAQQNDDGSWPGRSVGGSSGRATDIGLARSTAFAVMALAATKDGRWRPATDKALVRIEQRLPSIESANALAYVANALVEAGSKQLALKAADQLAALATRDGDVAYWDDAHHTWMGGYGVYASRETTALAAQALLATESQQDLLQPALNWIARGRGNHGGWGSTQATVWTLRALETLRTRGNHDATLRFYFETEQLPTITGKSELHVTKAPQPLRQFGFVPSSNEGRFVVDASAETAAMVQLVTEYAVDWDSRFADVDGEPFGGELELEERRTKRGRVTRAYARIENMLETDARMVIIEAPLPPGAFVPSDALDDLVQHGAIDMYEVLPTHVRFYVDAIAGKQDVVFAYDFVPLVRGTFSLPPLRAYPFYSPEPITEVDAGDLSTD